MTDPIELTARTCVGFARQLRDDGIPVSPEQTAALYRTLHLLGRVRLRDLYWAGRVIMVTGREQLPVYDAAFRAYFLAESDGNRIAIAFPQPTPTREVSVEAPSAGTPGTQPAERLQERADEARLTPSDVRLFKDKSFATMTAEERRRAAALVRRLDASLPRRPARRRIRTPRGRHLDIRGSLRAALRTDGEPMRLARRRNPLRERTLTLIIDVSGSMTPYALVLLRFAHTLTHAGHQVEAFTVGTRLTRITGELRRPSVDAALRRVAAAVTDWDGGTMLGTSFAALLRRYGGHRALRGAVVVICSDGLDRGEPATLAEAMRVVHRIAHGVIWLNPLKGDPRYRPLQRAMAAALPHVDVFLPAHNLASLEQLCTALAASRGSA